MPFPGNLIHAGMRDKVARAFRQKVTIQQNTPTRSDTGAEVASWANLAGHVNLRCAVSVQAATGVQRDQMRRTDEIAGARIATRIVLIAAYKPKITTKMRALIDDEPWEIISVDRDSQLNMTRIGIREVS